ncbi:hypothetical protein AB0L13_35080 [Saccharopolyspora shandongensis]
MDLANVTDRLSVAATTRTAIKTNPKLITPFQSARMADRVRHRRGL